MKLAKILFGQAVRLVRLSNPAGGSIYGANLVKACEERYGFLQGPRVLADYDFSKGITFLHGWFQRRVVIDKFAIFENGLLAEAKIDTDECEAFLLDIIQWLKNFDIQATAEPEAPRFYWSQIEVAANPNIFKAFQAIAPLGRTLTEITQSYNHPTPSWEPSGVSFGIGPTDPTAFKFERREAAPTPDIFFSAAKLRTSDHLQALQQLEALLGG